jgi:M6 family metalloprotease-like protein
VNYWRLIIGVIAVAILACPTATWGVSANPSPFQVTQPDGAKRTVRVFGDEWHQLWETTDGYAVVQDGAGWWVYAGLDAAGRYAPTNFPVGSDDPSGAAFLSRVGRHLRENTLPRAAVRDLAFDKGRGGTFDWLREIARRSGKTSINIPVILIQYPDNFASQSPVSFDSLMNQPGYRGTGSFREYYQQISYGQLTVNATIVGWYTAPQNRSYYAYGNGDLVRMTRAKQLVRTAVDRAQAAGGLNWGSFDNDNDGNVDVVSIVHQGPGAENGNTQFVWSQQWFLNSAGTDYSVMYGGRRIDSYVLQPEISATGGHIEIGVFCHEFGHALGLPDLYDTDPADGASEGVGIWCVMGSGSWGGDLASPQTPTHMCAWAKMQQWWLTPTVVSGNPLGTPVASVETMPQAYQLWTNGAQGSEYFLVENRQPIGFDANLPGGGLAIWHIDETRRRMDDRDNADETRKLVDLEEADNLGDLDNSTNAGDAGDLYPGGSGNRAFGGGTSPNSDDYNGAPTLVRVINVSNPGPVMTADFYTMEPPPAPNFLIRDCPADTGGAPDVPCARDFYRSLDIWLDNDDNGLCDEPDMGKINHLYVRAWNLGGATTDARVKCWYTRAGAGLRFGLDSPRDTAIVDARTFETEKVISTMGTLAPTPGGQGYRVYFNWRIPPPPPYVNHYCIGCAIENAADPQVSADPLREANLAQINLSCMAEKRGFAPAKRATSDTTIFRQAVVINNPFSHDAWFRVAAESLSAGYEVLPAASFTVHLPAEGDSVAVFDIVKTDSRHMDSTSVHFALYALPGLELLGAVHRDLLIDDVAPNAVGAWDVQDYRPYGDDYPRPTPTQVLTWLEPTSDVLGYPEKIRHFEVHSSTDPYRLLHPDSATLIAETREDANPAAPGDQYYFYAEDAVVHYFTVIPVDLAGNKGPAAPIRPVWEPSDIDSSSARFGLSLGSPNPSVPPLRIRFSLPQEAMVSLAVFDIGGRRIASLARAKYGRGEWEIAWDGRNDEGGRVPAGVFFVKMAAGGFSSTKVVVLLE